MRTLWSGILKMFCRWPGKMLHTVTSRMPYLNHYARRCGSHFFARRDDL